MVIDGNGSGNGNGNGVCVCLCVCVCVCVCGPAQMQRNDQSDANPIRAIALDIVGGRWDANYNDEEQGKVWTQPNYIRLNI